MPFNPRVSLLGVSSWPAKTKQQKQEQQVRPRHTSVDLAAVSDDFGVPHLDDPDPFGVLALEKAGMLIKEAGTHNRASSESFEFRPSPSSPVFRHSVQSFEEMRARRNSRRDSKRSVSSTDHGTQTADLPEPETPDMYTSPTQIAAPDIPSPLFENQRIEDWSADVDRNHSRQASGSTKPSASPRSPLRTSWVPRTLVPQDAAARPDDDDEEAERRRIRSMSASQRLSDALDKLERESQRSAEPSPRTRSTQMSPLGHSGAVSPVSSESEDESDIDDAEPIIVEQVVQAAPASKLLSPTIVSPTIARPKLVTIKGRPAPALPARNPARQRRTYATRVEPGAQPGSGAIPKLDPSVGGEHTSGDMQDESSSACSVSPSRSAFDRNSDDHASLPWSEQTSLADLEEGKKYEHDAGSPRSHDSANQGVVMVDSGVGPMEADLNTASSATVESRAVGLGIESVQLASESSTATDSSSQTSVRDSAAAVESLDSIPAASQALKATTTNSDATSVETQLHTSSDHLRPESSEHLPTPIAPQITFAEHVKATPEADAKSISDDDAVNEEDDAFHSMPPTPHGESVTDLSEVVAAATRLEKESTAIAA